MFDKMLIYNHLPVMGQNLLCSMIGMKIKSDRFNKHFYELLEEGVQRQSWSYEQQCEYRDNALKKLALHAAKTVPYYQRIFKEYGLNEDSIKRLEDLKKLPIINKEIIKENYSDFISGSFLKKYRLQLHTSGSTGSGFIFYSSNEAFLRQWANGWRWYQNLGISPDDWCGHFGGRAVVPTDSTKPPFYRYNYPCKQLLFSAYHMNDTNLKYYIQELDKNKIRWLHGYPSSIVTLAKFVIEHNISFKYPIIHITVCSENLYDYQREIIYKAFNVYPLQNYAQTEGVAVFTECKPGIIRVDDDYSAVEFVDVNQDGATHIVGTNLWNYCMPFLRYDTKDLAVCQKQTDGRYIVSLDGRLEDYVILSDGSRVGRLDHLFKDMQHVNAAQIVQNEKGKIQILIVKNDGYDKNDETILQREIEQRFSERLEAQIIYTDNIPKTKNGKQRFVVSKIK